MLTAETLEGMYRRLYVYDVYQRGWVHEPLGFYVNANHTQTHLVKATSYKDLTADDAKQTILGEVTPDVMQYGLRLSRWAEFPVSELEVGAFSDDVEEQIDRFSTNYPRTRHDIVAIDAARSILSVELLHDAEHQMASGDEPEFRNLRKASVQAGRLLMYAADMQLRQYGADADEVFDARLAKLRIDFHKPPARGTDNEAVVLPGQQN